jgi:predicted ArsR family transcriptional regulator
MARTETSSTRNQILRALKTNAGSTILELAELVDVSPVTVRHHLNSLQADGFVEARTVKRRSVGRPFHVFYLTDAAEELFPRKYLGLTRRLLDQIKTNLPAEAVVKLFEEMAGDIIADYQARFEGRSKAERMAVLVEILENEGFVVSWEKQNGEYVLIEHSCPYRNLGQEHTDICTLDRVLITRVLDSPVKKTSCLLDGDHSCAYVIGGDLGTATGQESNGQREELVELEGVSNGESG